MFGEVEADEAPDHSDAEEPAIEGDARGDDEEGGDSGLEWARGHESMVIEERDSRDGFDLR